MLEIYPVQKKEEQERLCHLCGLEYDADALCYAAYVNEIEAGAVQFAIHESRGYLYDIRNTRESDDSDALFIMGRAALNYIDLCGVHDAYFSGKDTPDELISRIGFKKRENGEWYMNLAGFFASPCSHDKKE